MAEYIEQAALLKNIAEIRAKHGLKEDEEMEFSETDIVGLLLCAPAADVAPVRHGKWVIDEEKGMKHCSECGCRVCFDHIYCHDCGAKMDGGADSE